MSAHQSPSFEKPPVIEIFLGAQFDPLPNLTNAHIGAFWAKFGMSKWPAAQDAYPMPQSFEKFGSEQIWTRTTGLPLSITVSGAPASRVRFKNPSADRMIQMQNGNFWYHWLGLPGATYPRYELIRDEFVVVFEQFVNFTSENGLGPIHSTQWETCYLNHLPHGTVWREPSDWTKVFNSNAMLPAAIGDSRLEQFAGRWTYEITPGRGRLHVELSSVKEKTTNADILVFQLLARGPTQETGDILERFTSGFDVGHDTIVNGFRDLTSAEARAFWKELT